MGFSKLPSEIIEHIFLDLDPLTLARCRAISRELNKLIGGSVSLQIIIEAGIDGLLVVGPHDRHLGYPFSSAKHLLDEIFRIREALRQFIPRSVWETPYEPGPFEISDGIICSTVLGGVEERLKSFHFNEMLAPTDEGHDPFELDPTGKRYTRMIQDIDAGAIDLVFFTGFDLVVLLEEIITPDIDKIDYRLHFKTISTGVPHPEATLPHIEYTSPLSPEIQLKTSIQLYDDMVALLLVQEDTRGGVTVWNWKSGEVIVPCQSALTSMFLSQDQLLLVRDSNGDPLAFTDFRNMHMVVYSISKGCITHRIKLPLLALLDPFLFTYPRQTLLQIPPAQVAGKFAPDPSLDIFALRFWTPYANYDDAECTVVFSTQRLLEACKAAFVDQEQYPVDVEWSIWGPKSSRWFPPYSLSGLSERGIHGPRLVALTRSNALDMGDRIGNWASNENDDLGNPVILDFNPRPILQGATNCDFPLCRNTVVRDIWSWTILEREKEVVIESGLPFRAFVHKEEWSDSDIYLHSTALVSVMEKSNKIYSFLQHPNVWYNGKTTE
ncbi:hypothetical protein FRC14_003093 [Serendipita sp. 396]|nr:hypothetical protein FRC14_003093 [Serendipita sp. 396]KAG8821967.1 hypothetical protein FRC19_006912 [Serendipita sp. 401]KAG8867734.1 hypothetical protein FRC20_005045 [Serendipita sp. 405]